jgi:hypothetical protein
MGWGMFVAWKSLTLCKFSCTRFVCNILFVLWLTQTEINFLEKKILDGQRAVIFLKFLISYYEYCWDICSVAIGLFTDHELSRLHRIG